VQSYDELKFYWYIKIRWVVIFFISILFIPALKVGYLEIHYVPHYLALTSLLLFINLEKLWERVKIYQQITFHLVFDIIAFTSIIYISGRMENPFWPLIYLQTSLAAFILKPKHDLYFLPFLILSMITIHLTSFSFHSALFYTILPQWLILLCAWVPSRIIGLAMIRQKEHLSKLQEKELQIKKIKTLGALSAGILHEIGTPLNTMRLKVNRITQQKKYDEKDLSILDKALSQCEETVSKLNKAQHENAENIMEQVQIGRFIESLSEKWKIDYPAIRFKIRNKTNGFCLIAKTNFMLVMKVILDNAIDENCTYLDYNISSIGDEIFIEIHDNGPGFSNFVLENFGAPYTSTKGRGRGLGLFSSFLSIESMGAKMSIENTEQGGCVKFIFNRI